MGEATAAAVAARRGPGADGAARTTDLLAVDLGNTATRLGAFAGEELLGTWDLTTPERITVDEAYAQIVGALSTMGVGAPSSSILASVVPQLTDAWRSALARACPSRPLVVGPGLKTGLRMRYDDPAEVGADRVADALAARISYGAPVVVVDLGTTTNIEVVDASGSFAGGVIAPGVALGARSLAQAAARLPVIELKAPPCAIGRSTRAAMQSGVVLGEVARIDGLLDAVMDELGEAAPVVITGDGASAMAALISHEVTVDETLTVRGLMHIWRANRR